MKKTTINAMIKAIEDNFSNVKKLAQIVGDVKQSGDWKKDKIDGEPVKNFKIWLEAFIIPKCDKLSASTLDAYANAHLYVWSIDGCAELSLYKAQSLVRSAKHDPKKFAKGVKSGTINVTNNNRAELKSQAEKCVGLSGNVKTTTTDAEKSNGAIEFSVRASLEACVRNCEVAINNGDKELFTKEWNELKRAIKNVKAQQYLRGTRSPVYIDFITLVR